MIGLNENKTNLFISYTGVAGKPLWSFYTEAVADQTTTKLKPLYLFFER